MTIGTTQRFIKIEQRLAALEKKFEAMKTDLEQAPPQLQDLIIPRFPHILDEIGYDPPKADRSSAEE